MLRPPLNRSHKAAAGKDEWEVVETFGLGPFGGVAAHGDVTGET